MTDHWNEDGDEQIRAFLEGEMTAEERYRFEARIEASHALFAEVEAWRRTRSLIERDARAVHSISPPRSFAEALAAREVRPIWHRPSWVNRSPAVSIERLSSFRAEFGAGHVDVDAVLSRDLEHGSLLTISWESSFLPERAWCVQVRREADGELCRSTVTAPVRTGRLSLSEKDLGWDPSRTTFDVGIAPR